MTLELMGFAEAIGLDRVASGRYSILLLLGLYGGMKSGQLNPAKVIYEIEALEGIRERSRLKPPSVFERAPLKGLWHKHYLEDGLASMAKNLRRGIHKYGLPWLDATVADAEASGEERFFTEQDVGRLVHDVVVGNWERLNADSALTGEWIIFAQHEGKNYYLCLGRHQGGDDFMRSQIDAVCVSEFPFLAQLLTNNGTDRPKHDEEALP
jgi:hypothetical protein